jgi:hypothetical protein
VGAVTAILLDHLRQPVKAEEVQRARELFMYVARQYSGASLREIVARLGVRDIADCEPRGEEGRAAVGRGKGLSGVGRADTTSIIPFTYSSLTPIPVALTTPRGYQPLMVAGEPVKAIRVAATYGGGSTLTYITASGKEVRLR